MLWATPLIWATPFAGDLYKDFGRRKACSVIHTVTVIHTVLILSLGRKQQGHFCMLEARQINIASSRIAKVMKYIKLVSKTNTKDSRMLNL